MKVFVMIMQDVTNPYELRTGVFKTKQEAINAVLDIYKQEHDICNVYGEPGDYSLIEEQLWEIDACLDCYNEYKQDGDNRLFTIKETVFEEE